jgi:hypothetical protein
MRLSMCALLAIACGAPPVALDAGSDAQAPIEIAAPIPPAPAAPVVLTPCAEGWRMRDTDAGVIVCEPWAEDRAPECAEDEVAIPGAGCVALDDCPEDGWPAALPSSGVVYVRAGVKSGDGTRERPFATLSEAIDAATATDVIALAPGEYTGGVTLEASALRGACAAETIIRFDGTGAALSISSAGGIARSVSGVSIIGEARGLRILQNAIASASDVIAEARVGLRLETNASFTGERMRIEGARETNLVADFAVALRVHSDLTLRSSSVHHGACGGIGNRGEIGDPSPVDISIDLADVAILDTPVGIGDEYERLLGARLVIERVNAGIVTPRRGTTELSELRGRDVSNTAGLPPLFMAATSEVHLSRVALSRIHDIALLAGQIDDGAHRGTITGEDVFIEDVTGSAAAVEVDDGVRVDLTRVHVLRAHKSGFLARSGQMFLRDVWFTDGDQPIDLGLAFLAIGSGELSIERGRVRGPDISRGLSRLAVGAGTGATVVIEDLEVEGGMGVIAQCTSGDLPGVCLPGAIEIRRASLRNLVAAAIASDEWSRIRLSDIEIVGVTTVDVPDVPARSDAPAYGLVTGEGGAIEAERVYIRGVPGFPVLASSQGSTIAISDLRVEDTGAPVVCEGCELVLGSGLACEFGGQLDLTRFDVSGSAIAGLIYTERCVPPSFEHGLVHENSIGVLTDGVDDPTLLRGIRVYDNDVQYNARQVVIDPPDFSF